MAKPAILMGVEGGGSFCFCYDDVSVVVGGICVVLVDETSVEAVVVRKSSL
jgi:hypothetical protein